MTPGHLSKEDITFIKRALLSASPLIEDAACRAGGDKDLQERLRDIGGSVSNELLYLDMIAPRIERPAAGRAQ